MSINKVVESAEEAIADICDGASIMFGGFGGGGGGMPNDLIMALRDKGVKNLTLIGNNIGLGTKFGPYTQADLSLLFENKQVKKCIACFPIHPRPRSVMTAGHKQIAAGEVELELVPHGILAERVRAAGAGIRGFYTTVGVGTVVEKGKEKRVIGGEECIFELPLSADFALIRAHKADKWGNLVYRGITRVMNTVMVTAARNVVVEADEVVEVGELEPDQVNTPMIYVDRIVKSTGKNLSKNI